MKYKILMVSFLIAGLFLVTACTEKVADNDAPRACTMEYMPVCGVDNVTYGNKCTAGDVEIVHEGECAGQNQNEGTQIANPASTFCVENGGTLDIRNEENGQVGYCTINGKECEEWALFRGECAEVHVCTSEEKSAQICTKEYMPVCGSDGQTYGNKCNACAEKVDYWIAGECKLNYEVTQVTNVSCSIDEDCETPMEYLLMSRCPFTSKCLEEKCTVVCPLFDGTGYPDVKDCGTCPQLSPPSPDFCKDGEIVSGGTNECGCNLPPRCGPITE